MKTAALLLLAVIAPTATFAVPLEPIEWGSHVSGYSVPDIGIESLIYDATTDRLNYVAHGLVEPGAYFGGTPIELQFDHVFAFSMGIDERGRITDGGSMLWLGDFGSGFEVLASGSVRRLGFVLAITSDESLGENIFASMQVLFHVDFLDPRVAFMGRSMVLLHEEAFPTQYPTPFYESFTCPALSLPCNYFSTSGLVGLNVPEPDTLALVSMSLVGIALFRRRRRLRSL